MHSRSIVFGIFAIAVCLAESAGAQQPRYMPPAGRALQQDVRIIERRSPRYVPPAGNTLPNALNYFRRDVGVLDPYNTFVAPRQQLDYQLQTMTAQQQANFRDTQRTIAQIRASEAAPTGVGAGFMNYSHYYRSRP